MKKIISFFLIALFAFSQCVSAFAHSGGTDANGGHYDHSTGEYHYHHGYPAHQHYDMDGDGDIDCPYDFDDMTGQNSGSSSNSTSSSSSTNSINSISRSEKEQIIKNVKNGTDDHSGWLLTFRIAGILFVVYIAALIALDVKERIQQKKRNTREEAKAKAEYETERNELIERIGNKSLREIAEVPHNIQFINSLPVDNNDSLFGSFTVYISASGNCYHTKKGCSSANKAMHILKARRKYKPCSRCCQRSYQVPQWYLQYADIRDKCEKYNVSYNE